MRELTKQETKQINQMGKKADESNETIFCIVCKKSFTANSASFIGDREVGGWYHEYHTAAEITQARIPGIIRDRHGIWHGAENQKAFLRK